MGYPLTTVSTEIPSIQTITGECFSKCKSTTDFYNTSLHLSISPYQIDGFILFITSYSRWKSYKDITSQVGTYPTSGTHLDDTLLQPIEGFFHHSSIFMHGINSLFYHWS